MRRIQKEAFLAVFLLSTLLAPIQSYGDELACPMQSCGPCSGMATNPENLPADAPSFNPLSHYIASSELARCRGYFSGFYLGAAYGIGDIDYQLKIADNALLQTNNNVRRRNSLFRLNGNSRGYVVTAFNGGYSFVVDYFFLGAELGYSYRSRAHPVNYCDPADFLDTTSITDDSLVEATSAPCRVRIEVNSQHAASADLLPGFVYSRFVAYFRLGAEQTNYTWHRRVSFPFIDVNTVANTVLIEGQEFVDSQKKNTTGYRVGAGLGVAAGPHVSFHLNYVHIFNNNLNISPSVNGIAGNVPIITLPGGVSNSTTGLRRLAANSTIEPQRNEVTFGVKFRF